MICDDLERAARLYRTAPAYRTGETTLTYGELWDSACRMADLLRRQGTGPVVLAGEKEPYMLTGILACLLSRRAYVPLERSQPRERAEKIIRASGASLVLGRGEGCMAPEALERYAACSVQEQNGDTAYILFTSGTTGEPKGVPISRGNLLHFTDWIRRLEPLASYTGCHVLEQAGFGFDLSTADLYYALTGGHTLTALTDRDPAAVTALMRSHSIHVAMITPTFGRMCLLEPAFCAEQIPSLRCLYFCGEMLPPGLVKKLWARFPALEILNAYGPTEATSAVSAVRIRREMLDWDRLPVGEPGGYAAKITAEGEEGELVLRGKSVFGGYLQGGGVFRENGEYGYRTGDLGYFENGYLFCAGRRDCQIKYKGYRIEPGEIEKCIAALPGVADCAVVPVRGADGAVRYLTAYIVGETGALREKLRDRLPEWMIPRVVRSLPVLPVNANGKTDRKALEEYGYHENTV